MRFCDQGPCQDYVTYEILEAQTKYDATTGSSGSIGAGVNCTIQNNGVGAKLQVSAADNNHVTITHVGWGTAYVKSRETFCGDAKSWLRAGTGCSQHPDWDACKHGDWYNK